MMLNASKPEKILDLHGKSSQEAQKAVEVFLEQALKHQLEKVTVITGLGNHRGFKGKRGVFFKNLPEWLNKAPFRLQIRYLLKEVGSYQIVLESSMRDDDPSLLISHEEKLKKAFAFYAAEHPIVKVIQSFSGAHRQESLQTLLDQNPALLRETAKDGSTVLMVAAVYNQIHSMKSLLSKERDLKEKPALLRQCTVDGTNALIMAVLCQNKEAINFLLQKAPGLLKKKRLDGASVLTLAAQTSNPRKMLQFLYVHLEPHRRERGYTPLFREYKSLMKALFRDNNAVADNQRIPLLESQQWKRYQQKYGWIYPDEILPFLKKQMQSNSFFSKRIWKKRLHLENRTPAQIRKILDFFEKNSSKKIKKLLLRFRSAQKPRIKKRLKEVVGLSLLLNPKKPEPKTPKTAMLFLNVERGLPQKYPSVRTPALILKPDKTLDLILDARRMHIDRGLFHKEMLELFRVHQKKQRVLLSQESFFMRWLSEKKCATQTNVFQAIIAKPVVFSVKKTKVKECVDVVELYKKTEVSAKVQSDLRTLGCDLYIFIESPKKLKDCPTPAICIRHNNTAIQLIVNQKGAVKMLKSQKIEEIFLKKFIAENLKSSKVFLGWDHPVIHWVVSHGGHVDSLIANYIQRTTLLLENPSHLTPNLSKDIDYIKSFRKK